VFTARVWNKSKNTDLLTIEEENSSLNEAVALDLWETLNAEGKLQASIHQRARKLRDSVFGNKIFIRGVVEVSNFCRQNCNYCGMRRDNRDLNRFRLSKEVLLDLLLNQRPSSITDINIQAGEDPIVVREVVVPLIRELKKRTSLGISVCLGTLSEKDYALLRESGAEYYILKIETGDPKHYKQIQSPGDLETRVKMIRHLATAGWNVSSGLIMGLPFQTKEHLIQTLELLRDLPLAGCSVSPFIAGTQTPFGTYADGSLEMSLNCLAWMRLTNPDRILPAVSAMGLVGDDGYARAIQAGANLATINLTPSESRKDYVLYKRERLIMDEKRVLKSIEKAGCVPSTLSLRQHLEIQSL
jgi:biotin synthase